jgi:bifunctional DNA-binding transcriptional regulator/antitoxin component of YhaV-PrlF toxin-antitoxin module
MMKISERGQITIPQPLLERYGLLPDTEVEFIEREGGLVLVKSPTSRRKRIRIMYGQVKTGKTTDELMALLRD